MAKTEGMDGGSSMGPLYWSFGEVAWASHSEGLIRRWVVDRVVVGL